MKYITTLFILKSPLLIIQNISAKLATCALTNCHIQFDLAIWERKNKKTKKIIIFSPTKISRRKYLRDHILTLNIIQSLATDHPLWSDNYSLNHLYTTTMYACMYICIYICMHVCMFVCMYACMHACMYVHMYVCMYV